LQAKIATSATLKFVEMASGNDKIRRLRQAIQADFMLALNPVVDGKKHSFSDAYDLFHVAFLYLWEKAIQGKTIDAVELITLKTPNKDGTPRTKEKSVFQLACQAVRREIYANKSLEMSKKFVYIEDYTTPELEAELLKVYKLEHLTDFETYTTVSEMLSALDLSKSQLDIIKMRLKGFSETEIANKLGVSQQAISKRLHKIQEAIILEFPEMVRLFKQGRMNANRYDKQDVGRKSSGKCKVRNLQ
jgi:predicted DNA-binding protein YlxM (UPF0122 family)